MRSLQPTSPGWVLWGLPLLHWPGEAASVHVGASTHAVLCRLAGAFIKPSFFRPLLQGRDALAGIHANTHLAQVLPGGNEVPGHIHRPPHLCQAPARPGLS